MPDRRLPATVEATAYFVVAEALTDVARHSRASHATVVARVEDGTIVVAEILLGAHETPGFIVEPLTSPLRLGRPGLTVRQPPAAIG